MKAAKKVPPRRAAPARAPARPAPSKAPKRPAKPAKPSAVRTAKPAARPAPKPAARVAPPNAPKAPTRTPVAPPPVPRTKAPPIASSSLRTAAPSGAVARAPTTPDLRPGDDLPGLTRGPLTRVDGARFAAASDFWSALSLDEPAARESGLPGAVIPGGLAFALASGVVQRWLGLSGRIVRIGARAVKLMWPGDVLAVRGRVVEVRAAPEGRRIDLDVWVENQKGELILRAQSHCLLPGVHLPAPPAPSPVPEPTGGVGAKGTIDPRPAATHNPARGRSGR